MLVDKIKTSINYIDITLDQIDLTVADDTNAFMDNLMSFDKIIIICTQKYLAKKSGGAAYEKDLIIQCYKKDVTDNKFILILRCGEIDTAIPIPLRNKIFCDMRNGITKTNFNQLIAGIKKKNTEGAMQKNKKDTLKGHKPVLKDPSKTIAKEVRIKVTGYSLISGGIDGIRYLWRDTEGNITESAAFNQRLKESPHGEDVKKTSAYTTSVSFGCYLHHINSACRFCASGSLDFKGFLTGNEIALQNIFMAEYDSDCPSFPSINENMREFAFMGQGEPGFSYQQVRKAILLTDFAMENINQKISRYIISSCGIPEFLDSLFLDYKNGIFVNKVTLHFSLHAIDEQRNIIMPINELYGYEDFLSKTRKIYDVSNNKVAISILMFQDFKSTHGMSKQHTTTTENIESILKKLDPAIHKIDLCLVNPTDVISKSGQPRNEFILELVERIEKLKFEVKPFYSFGRENNTGCGMLSSDTKKMVSAPGKTTLEHFDKALNLLDFAEKKYRDSFLMQI
jgi:adenine C2-methylase RlmN of 23S rRNA A2503 and tRNA A37